MRYYNVIKALSKKDLQGEFYKDKYFWKYLKINGPHFSVELAKKLCSDFVNFDNTKGAHWSNIQDIITTYKGRDNALNFSAGDYYYAVNNLYSDFGSVISESNIVEMSHLMANDVDGAEGGYFYSVLAKFMNKKINIEWENYIA